ncbi:unnamed protein product, partial [Rangifer tarandus platyrhynchus]
MSAPRGETTSTSRVRGWQTALYGLCLDSGLAHPRILCLPSDTSRVPEESGSVSYPQPAPCLHVRSCPASPALSPSPPANLFSSAQCPSSWA